MRTDRLEASRAPLPAGFRRVRLERAREPDHPGGDAHIGYTLVAPLLDDGHIDGDLVRAHPERCTIVRFHHGAESMQGHLHRGSGGSWAFRYGAPGETRDDDPVYRLGSHRFSVGEYVTISEDDGAHTYRVVSVAPL